MENDELDQLISNLDLDQARPAAGHENRFRKKMEIATGKRDAGSNLFKLWPSIIGIAAVLLVAILIFPGLLIPAQPQKRDLGSVSVEMKNTQSFYTSAIQQELQSLQELKSPGTDRMIQDALAQLETLENDYESLKTDLANSGNDQRVIYAMVSNFQKRMDLLSNLIEKAQSKNDYTPTSHENDYL